jgi:hypothetical protein
VATVPPKQKQKTNTYMSLRKINDGVGSWNNRMMFPKNRYTLRCIEEDFSPSKATGNPMLIRKWEICQNEPVLIGDKKVDIDGLTIQQYVVTKVKTEDGDDWDADRSDKAFGRFAEDLRICGFPEDSDIDDENPPCFMKGKVVDAIVYGKENPSYQSPTADEIKAGKRVGQPILDAAGKPVKNYQLNIDSILGLSTVVVNRPY